MTIHVKVVDSDILTKTLPTGSVILSDGGKGGHFTSPLCTLIPRITISECTVGYTTSALGPITITTTYAGDGIHHTSSGTSALTVTLRNTISTVIPNPSTTTVGTKIAFHVKIVDSSLGTKTLPTGLVQWNDGGAGGIFQAHQCTLTPQITISECSVGYTPSKSGPVTITEIYSGDSTHLGSSDKSTLTVS